MTNKTLQPVILVIGYKDLGVVNSAWLSSSGIDTEREYYLLGKKLGEFDNAIDANECFRSEAEKYEYIEVKTVYALK